MTPLSQVSKPDQSSFYTIQALRFFAALMVVLSHGSYVIRERYDSSFMHFDLGANGVNLFFGISGFVMVLSSHKLVDMQDGWRVFMINRLIRIVPLYWLMTTIKIVLLIVASSLFVARTDVDIITIIKSYLFLPALDKDNLYRPIVGVGWTLNLEMFFYVVFAACLFLRLPRVAIASMAMLALASVPVFQLNLWPVLSFYTDAIVMHFVWGMLVAHLYSKGFRLSLPLSGLIGGAGMLFLFFSPQLATSNAVAFSFNSLAVFGILLAAVSLESTLKSYIHAGLRFFGDASYSLYLIHTSVLPIAPLLLTKLGFYNSTLALVGCVVGSVVASALLYVYVENPMTQKLRLWTQTMRKPSAVAA